MLVIKQFMVPINFHRIYFPTMSMGTNNCLLLLRGVYNVNDDNIFFFEWTILYCALSNIYQCLLCPHLKMVIKHVFSFHWFIMIQVGSVTSLRVRVRSEPCWGRVPHILSTRVIIGHNLWENYRWLSTVLSVAPKTGSVRDLNIQA